MIPIHFFLIWTGGYGSLTLTLYAVPRIGEYIILPGCGELGLKVTSVIHHCDRVTLQSRDDGFLPDDICLNAMRMNGWSIEGHAGR